MRSEWVSEWVRFLFSINTLQLISEMNLSSQLLTPVLTLATEQPGDKIRKKHKTKHTREKTMLRERTNRAWLSCLLRRPARKRIRSILWCYQPVWDSSSSSSSSPSGPWRPCMAISDLHSVDSGRASTSSWTSLSQTLRGRPGGLLQLAVDFLPSYRYPPSDAKRHVLVLQGPGVHHGQSLAVDNVRCHQRLTNQIAEAPLHWRHRAYQRISSICRWHLMWKTSSENHINISDLRHSELTKWHKKNNNLLSNMWSKYLNFPTNSNRWPLTVQLESLCTEWKSESS